MAKPWLWRNSDGQEQYATRLLDLGWWLIGIKKKNDTTFTSMDGWPKACFFLFMLIAAFFFFIKGTWHGVLLL